MDPQGGGNELRDPVYTAIASQRRRDVLRLLREHDTPLSVQAVSANLTVKDGQTMQTRLMHVHLPRLADAGLIRWDREAATIALGSHPTLDDPRFLSLLEAEADGLSETLAHLAYERRRLLLTILRDAPASMTRTDLARELLRADEIGLEPDPKMVDTVTATLHHADLPSLDDAGLLRYDRESGRAAPTDHPGLDEVFRIVSDPEDSLGDACDDFFEGLGTTYDDLRSVNSTEAEWPHFGCDSTHD